MPGLDVELQNIDSDYLVTSKTLHIGQKKLNSPFAAQVADKWTQQHKPLMETRGFNEFFRRIAPDDLTDKEDKIVRDISNTETADREICALFVSLTGEKEISKDHLYSLLRIQDQTSDILCAPLRPDLVDSINSDEKEVDEERYLKRYIAIFDKYVEAASELGYDSEIMATIPVLEWKYNRRIIQNIVEKGTNAVCVNFNGRSPTVDTQLKNVISPILGEFGSNDELLDTFTYSINAHLGRRDVASDFLSIAMGFDGIGGYHTPLKGDEEFFDKLNNMEKSTFRIFKPQDISYIEPKIEQLERHFPSKTNLRSTRVKSLAENGEAADARKVLRSEQMGLAANNLRKKITGNEAGELLKSNLEGDGTLLSRLETVRSMYDSRGRQSGLGEF